MTLEMIKFQEYIKTCNKNIENLTKILQGKKTTFEFYSNSVERIRRKYNGDKDANDDEICGICLSEIDENDIGITKCGHIYCYTCLINVVRKRSKCPYCSRHIVENEICNVQYERKKPEKQLTLDDKERFELINKLGTKLANLITDQKETDEHTIIFSVWDDLLKKIGKILKENGIENIFCKGNVYQRDKALKEFNSDNKIKVIMLSSESAAAGANLTKASRIIFIEPIHGTRSYRKNQERQAIGRAHRMGQKSECIKVIRYILKNTVEEEIYKMNQKSDQDYNAEYDILSEIDID